MVFPAETSSAIDHHHRKWTVRCFSEQTESVGSASPLLWWKKTTKNTIWKHLMKRKKSHGLLGRLNLGTFFNFLWSFSFRVFFFPDVPFWCSLDVGDRKNFPPSGSLATWQGDGGIGGRDATAVGWQWREMWCHLPHPNKEPLSPPSEMKGFS